MSEEGTEVGLTMKSTIHSLGRISRVVTRLFWFKVSGAECEKRGVQIASEEKIYDDFHVRYYSNIRICKILTSVFVLKSHVLISPPPALSPFHDIPCLELICAGLPACPNQALTAVEARGCGHLFNSTTTHLDPHPHFLGGILATKYGFTFEYCFLALVGQHV